MARPQLHGLAPKPIEESVVEDARKDFEAVLRCRPARRSARTDAIDLNLLKDRIEADLAHDE